MRVRLVRENSAMKAQHVAVIVVAVLIPIVLGLVWFFPQEDTARAATFPEQCLKDGNMWHNMRPMRNGTELPGDAAPGCMTANGLHHFLDYEEYTAAMNPPNSSVALTPGDNTPRAGVETVLTFAITAGDQVPELYIEHDRYLHVIAVSKDMSFFKHVHPEDTTDSLADDVRAGTFKVPIVFPAAGTYVIAVDYAHQLKHRSQTFILDVEGEKSLGTLKQYPQTYTDGDLSVALEYSSAIAGEPTTLLFTATENNEPITDMKPYLAAAMHIAVVKDDLSSFMHVHGEVHTPESPKTVSASHVHAPPPSSFGPTVEGHVTFPEPGVYTLFTEFARPEGVVRPVFTIRVD